MANATLEETVNVMVSLAVGDKLPMRKQVIDKLALQKPPLALDMSLYAQAMDDAKKVLAANKAPPAVKTLDSPLTALFMPGSLDKTMYRYDKKLMGLIKQSTKYTPPQERNIQKLATVLAQCEHQGVLDKSHAHAVTIRGFLKSGPDGQINTIDALWNECTLAGVYGDKTEQMFEPDNDASSGGKSQLPSSVHPVRDGATAAKFKRGRAGTPFTKLGVGFRVEGSYNRKLGEFASKLDASVVRVSARGMVPQVTIDWLMLENGKDVAGTVVGGAALAPRLNVAQEDLWNESGVCVARSLFGSTAFPLRDHEGGAILWAVSVAGLTGYDTEDWQVKNTARPWRPGEKCYGRVPPENILGYVVIDKLGDKVGKDKFGKEQSGWKFSVPPNAKWTFVHYPAPSQAKYMEEELAAWAGVTASVPSEFDFQL